MVRTLKRGNWRKMFLGYRRLTASLETKLAVSPRQPHTQRERNLRHIREQLLLVLTVPLDDPRAAIEAITTLEHDLKGSGFLPQEFGFTWNVLKRAHHAAVEALESQTPQPLLIMAMVPLPVPPRGRSARHHHGRSRRHARHLALA